MRYDQFTEYELDLLTAGVDGELPRRQAAELRDLVANRPAAAALFKQFQADAAAFRELPTPKVPRDLAAAVLARLPATTPKPARQRMPAWMPVAIAASILFTVASTSYLFFNVQEHRAMARAVRDQLPVVPPNTSATEPDRDSIVLAKSKPGPRVPRQNGKPGPDAEPLDSNALAQAPQPVEVAPMPRPHVDVVGAGILDRIKPLISASIRLNPIIEASDFGNADVQPLLAKELGRDPAFRLDLFARTPAAGWDAFHKAAKSAGIAVTVDAKTQDLLNRKVPVAISLYTEALTPAEVAALLGELAKQVKSTSPPAIGSTHLIPAGAAESRDAKDLFNVDLLPSKQLRLGQATADPKPLSADTLGKVANAVKKADKPAVAVAYLPTPMRTPSNLSKEVKDYLSRKGDRKPGTVAMLFVVR